MQPRRFSPFDSLAKRTLLVQAGEWPFAVAYGRPDREMLVTSQPRATAAAQTADPAMLSNVETGLRHADKARAADNEDPRRR